MVIISDFVAIDYPVQVLQLSSLVIPFPIFISKLLCQQLFFERGNISLLLWNTMMEHIDSNIQFKELKTLTDIVKIKSLINFYSNCTCKLNRYNNFLFCLSVILAQLFLFLSISQGYFIIQMKIFHMVHITHAQVDS